MWPARRRLAVQLLRNGANGQQHGWGISSNRFWARKAAAWLHLPAWLPGCRCDGDEAPGGCGCRAAPAQLLVSVVLVELAVGGVVLPSSRTGGAEEARVLLSFSWSGNRGERLQLACFGGERSTGGGRLLFCSPKEIEGRKLLADLIVERGMEQSYCF